jgi:hypothetical protein
MRTYGGAMTDYKITNDQLKQSLKLIDSIKENHHVKNEIYKIFWSVIDQKLPETIIKKVDLNEMEELKPTS